MENAAIETLSAKEHCAKHMHRYVLIQTNDGMCCDGIVEHVDDEMVCIAVPYCPGDWDGRAFTPFGGPFGGPFYPRRRFYRRTFPLGSLLALSLLPFYF